MNSQTSQNRASFRWKLLRKALLKHSLAENDEEISKSVRSFNRFSLFEVERNENGEVWNHTKTKLCIQIVKNQNTINHEDLTAFDNTGNVCIWASEEVMSFYCLENIKIFEGKSVCELGGGFSNLAGLFLAKCNLAKKVLLSDGNEKSIANVKDLIMKNGCKADCQVVRFDDYKTYQIYTNCFDVILCADCLFFDSFRTALAEVIYALLRTGGHAFIFAPKRGKTFDDFYRIAQEKFGVANVEVQHKYNSEIWNAHLTALQNEMYNQDLHYPILIKLKKNQ